MKHLLKINEFFNHKLYHISNKYFKNFSLKFLLKGQGVNKEGRGIYLSEDKNFLLNVYYNKKSKNNFLYTVVFNNKPILINFNEKVTDDIFERLLTLNDNKITAHCQSYNRDITGEGLLHNLRYYDKKIESKLVKCGIDGVEFISEVNENVFIKNYCIFNPDILNIISVNDI